MYTVIKCDTIFFNKRKVIDEGEEEENEYIKEENGEFGGGRGEE